eukprot:COSAG04_NODE_1309_length_7281_cov_4.025063_5_plen_74_part_00
MTSSIDLELLQSGAVCLLDTMTALLGRRAAGAQPPDIYPTPPTPPRPRPPRRPSPQLPARAQTYSFDRSGLCR